MSKLQTGQCGGGFEALLIGFDEISLFFGQCLSWTVLKLKAAGQDPRKKKSLKLWSTSMIFEDPS